MEEFSRPDPTESVTKDLKKKKRKYFSGDDFKSSWLAYRDTHKEAESGSRESRTEEEGTLGRWLKKFRNIFKANVQVKEISDKPAFEKEPPLRILANPHEATVEVEHQEVSSPADTAKEDLEDNGEMVITHYEEEDEDPRPYMETPNPSPIVSLSENLRIPEPTVPNRFDSVPVETLIQTTETDDVPAIMPGREQKHTADLERAVTWNEMYHKREERRLKTRVEKIERESRRLKKSQERTTKHQIRLEEAQTEKKPVAATSPERIQSQAEVAPIVHNVEQNLPAYNRVHQEMSQQEAKTAQEQQRNFEQAPDRPEKVPDAPSIQKRVEQAAEHDVPIERVYERKHEIKDEARQRAFMPLGVPVTAPHAAAYWSSQQEPAAQAPYVAPSFIPRGIPPAQNEQTGMYVQAVRGGFVTGIVILAIVITIWLVL